MKRSHIFALVSVCTLAFLMFFILSGAHAVFADTLDQYVPLAPLPGIGQAEANNLPTYLVSIFKFAIGLAGALAVVMITFGGFQYMTSEAIGAKSEGKERISQAFMGLLLAIASWLILNTVNPKTLKFELNPERIAPITAPTSNAQGAYYKYRHCFYSTASSTQTTRQTLGTYPYQADTIEQARTACYNSQPPIMMGAEPTNECPAGTISEAITCQRIEEQINP